MCRSRRELSNAYLLAKFGFDTAENEPSKVCPIDVEILRVASASLGDLRGAHHPAQVRHVERDAAEEVRQAREVLDGDGRGRRPRPPRVDLLSSI